VKCRLVVCIVVSVFLFDSCQIPTVEKVVKWGSGNMRWNLKMVMEAWMIAMGEEVGNKGAGAFCNCLQYATNGGGIRNERERLWGGEW